MQRLFEIVRDEKPPRFDEFLGEGWAISSLCQKINRGVRYVHSLVREDTRLAVTEKKHPKKPVAFLLVTLAK